MVRILHHGKGKAMLNLGPDREPAPNCVEPTDLEKASNDKARRTDRHEVLTEIMTPHLRKKNLP